MRFVTIAGALHALIDVDGAEHVAPLDALGLPVAPRAFIAAGGIEAAREARLTPSGPLTGVTLDAIVPDPRMVWAIGLNYRAHAEETGRPVPTVPTVFVKSPGSVVPTGTPIVIPPHVGEPDYEGEVAVVIGRRVRDVDVAHALDAVAGVTVAHDVSARDHQYVTGQFSWSKSFDTFCPLGPVLVTLDEVDVTHLSIETRLNGEVVQSSTTADLVFPIAQLVAHLAQGCTLEPGDVICTGTPAGVGAARQPPRFLRDGDVVEIEVGGVGTLHNPIRR